MRIPAARPFRTQAKIGYSRAREKDLFPESSPEVRMYLQPNMQNRVEQWKAQCLSKGNRSVLFGEGDSWIRLEDADGVPGYASRLDAIVQGYEAYFDFVRNYLGDIPIIGHIYAYPFPSGKSYRGMGMLDMAGPWFKPHLDGMQVPDPVRRPILKSLIDGFAERLLDLESRAPRFHVVDFRGKLDDEGFWQNEMHPTDEGFGLLGEEFVNVIESWTVG
jgi:hypothetical protein